MTNNILSVRRYNKVDVEFYCGMCQHYTYVKLDLSMNGNHIMNCPNCGHKHYRVVKDGRITEDRFNEHLKDRHEIIAMKSACVPAKERRHLGNIARIREQESTGQLN